MAAANDTVSLEELRSFHRIDRALYTILVMDLFRDPSECMLIMGFWLWFERRGISNVVNRILQLPAFLINEFANEAVTCLMRMNNQLNGMNEIPLTQYIAANEFSLQYFQENRLMISHQVHELASVPFMRVLSDIREQAMCVSFLHVRASRSWLIRMTEVSRHERTMFMTFSKGYPVNENEVRQFFERRFCECLESFHMQEVADGEQPLYARILVKRSYYITMILQGNNNAKFTINGKQVWMRRLVLQSLL